MDQKVLIAVLSLFYLLFADGSLAKERARPKDKPNILFFLVDDMGVMDTSALLLCGKDGSPERYPLNRWYRTPNMERLAGRGVRFPEFNAHSVCSPSRISIMTGQNSARHGTTNWIDLYHNNGNPCMPKAWNWEGIRKGWTTLPGVLREAGYRTILIGKAHFGPKNHFAVNPLNLGFDICIAGSGIGHPGSYLSEKHYGQRTRHPVPDLEKYWDSGTFLTEALTLEAVKTIDRSVEDGVPFFLYMSHYAVHAPYDCDPRFKHSYKRADRTRSVKNLAGLIEGMDQSLGDLMDHLEKRGVAENTLIIFMGDNGSAAPMGPANGIAASAPLRGMKGTMWEGGVRVPFIAAWAKPDPANAFQKKIPIVRGGISGTWGACYDLLPTLAHVGGARIPAGWKVDGRNILPLFADPAADFPHRVFLSHFPHFHASRRCDFFSTLRDGEWKIIRQYDPTGELNNGKSHDRLYNLKEDPSESNDLSGRYPGRLKILRRVLEKTLKEHGALLPEKGEPDPGFRRVKKGIYRWE